MWKPPRTTLLTIGSALLVIAPKCPVCFLAYFGIFGVATASVSVYRTWLPMVTASWLALTVATLAFQRQRQLRYGPVLLSVVAALVLLSGKFILDNQALIGAGFVALVAALVFCDHNRQMTRAAEICPQCEELPMLRDKKST